MSYITDSVRRGSANARPTAAAEGTMYMCTDSPIQFVMKNGAWQPYLGSMPLVTPPPAASFSIINNFAVGIAGVTQLSDYRGGLLLQATVGGEDMRIAKRSIPSLPYRCTVHVLPTFNNTANAAANFAMAGIVSRQSSNGTVQGWSVVSNVGVEYLQVRAATASGTGNQVTFTDSTLLAQVASPHTLRGWGVWLRIEDDGSTRTFSHSADGQNFVRLVSQPRTTTLTPDEIGVYVGNIVTGVTTIDISAFFTSFELVSTGMSAQLLSTTADNAGARNAFAWAQANNRRYDVNSAKRALP